MRIAVLCVTVLAALSLHWLYNCALLLGRFREGGSGMLFQSAEEDVRVELGTNGLLGVRKGSHD